MIDAVTQFTNLYYNIVNLLTSESGRQFLENPAGYTSQKRIVVCFIKAIPEVQGLFSYYSPSRNPDTPIGNFLFCFQNLFQYIVIGNFLKSARIKATIFVSAPKRQKPRLPFPSVRKHWSCVANGAPEKYSKV